MAADGLYDDDHPRLLASAIDTQLTLHVDGRVLVMTPLRDSVTSDLIKDFRQEMARKSHPLSSIREGTITGQDDWATNLGLCQVACWWAVFQRHPS